ncbi:MAG: methyl-accepting chemotaxis protein [Treponema sp.]|nr:methyl-accepting chemotaxis protein [Treponema sp.]
MRFIHTIWFKLLLATFLIISISLGAIGVLSYKTTFMGIEGSINTELGGLYDKMSVEINEMNRAEYKLLHGIAALPELKDDKPSLWDKYMLTHQLASIDERYVDIAPFDENGGTYMGPNYIMYGKEVPHVKAALVNGKDFVAPPLPGENTFFLCYAVPVFNNENKINNMVSAIVPGDYLAVIVDRLSDGGKYKATIVDDNGIIIGDTNKEYIQKATNIRELSEIYDEEFVSNLMSGKRGHAAYFNENGEKMLASYGPVGDTCSWSIICAAPYDSYYAGVEVFKKIIIGVTLVTIIIALAIIFVLLRVFLKPLGSLNKSVNHIAQGNADLSKRIEQNTKSEVGDVIFGFNQFTEKLQVIMKGLKESKEELIEAGTDLEDSTHNTESSISEILESINTVCDQIQEQSKSVSGTACAVSEITGNIESLDKMIENHSQGVSQASSAIESLIESINAVNKKMDEIAGSIRDLSGYAKEGSLLQMDVNEKIEQIKSQSETLREANSVIASIAEQTNLLAMNAAIEAAHAGEAGKGFSVVADEIRKLSETSSAESKTIGDHLSAIHTSIDNVAEVSGKSSSAFRFVSEKISDADVLVSEIKVAIDEQNMESGKIGEALSKMNDSTLEVRNAGREMSAGNQAILEEVCHLEDNAGRMSQCMESMTESAGKIRESGTVLGEISERLRTSIDTMGSQIDQFKV